MTIDDPISAVRKQLELEDAYNSPVEKTVIDFLRKIPLGWFFDKVVIQSLKDRLSKQDSEKIKLLLETCANESQRHEAQIKELQERLSPDERAKREEELIDLLMDGARKAQATRARERIQRMGIILANAATEATLDSDEVEEMTRIAMHLTDGEVAILRELVRIQGRAVDGPSRRIERYQAHQAWEQARWAKDAGIESACAKLESYGLASRIAPPNNLNIFADIQSRFALLYKGVRFMKFIESSA